MHFRRWSKHPEINIDGSSCCIFNLNRQSVSKYVMYKTGHYILIIWNWKIILMNINLHWTKIIHFEQSVIRIGGVWVTPKTKYNLLKILGLICPYNENTMWKTSSSAIKIGWHFIILWTVVTNNLKKNAILQY